MKDDDEDEGEDLWGFLTFSNNADPNYFLLNNSDPTFFFKQC